MTLPAQRPRRSRDKSISSYIRQASPLEGEILLEILRAASGEVSSRSSMADSRGILLQVIPDAQPPPRGWKKKILPPTEASAGQTLPRPISVGKRWRIFPGQKPSPVRPSLSSNRIPLIIEAGAGFGSGSHETTRLCLRLMERIPPARSMLDLGCGSGILAIAGIKKGFRHALAVDIDPAALRNARHNARLNHCETVIQWKQADLSRWKHDSRHDLVTANLLSGLISENPQNLAGWTKPGGHLLVSGILRKEVPMIEGILRQQGFCPRKKLFRGRWSALLWTKNNTQKSKIIVRKK